MVGACVFTAIIAASILVLSTARKKLKKWLDVWYYQMSDENTELGYTNQNNVSFDAKIAAILIIQVVLFVFFALKATDNHDKYVPTLYSAMCDDGEKSYGAASKLDRAIENDTGELLKSIQAMQTDTPDSLEKQQCRKALKREFRQPFMINAILTTMRSEWGYGGPPWTIKNELRKYIGEYSRDPNMYYFLDQLVNSY